MKVDKQNRRSLRYTLMYIDETALLTCIIEEVNAAMGLRKMWLGTEFR